MKEYFSHDYNARNDTKLVKLFMKLGLKGIGAYWCIIEMLYEEGGYLLRSEYERISFELRTEPKFIKNIIEDFDLFKKDTKKVWSETALDRLNKRIEKSTKARESVQKRWKKYERNTNVLQTKNDCNTSKVKESKVKENKDIIKSVIEYLNTKTNKKFKYSSKKTIDLINARLNEGFVINDFEKVIDNKTKDWISNKEMNEYLRPETLFSNKFEGYLNITEIKEKTKEIEVIDWK